MTQFQENISITRKAIGKSAKLGWLYDVRLDDFTGANLYKDALPADIIEQIDIDKTHFECNHDESFVSKSNKLKVEAELKVSVLMGLFSLEGTGKYLGDEKKSKKTCKSSFIYQTTTKEEHFNPFHHKLENLAVPFNLANATHVVCGIKYGANAILSVEYDNVENKKGREIEGKFKAVLEKMKVSVNGDANVNFDAEEETIKRNMRVHFVGDVVLGNDIATSVDDLSKMIDAIKNKLTTANGGKGVPIEFKLYPLKHLEKLYKTDFMSDLVLMDLNQSVLDAVVNEFEKLSQQKQEFNDFYDLLKRFRAYINVEDIDEFEDMENKIRDKESKLRQQMSKLIVGVRKADNKMYELDAALNEYREKENLAKIVRDFIKSKEYLSLLIEKLEILLSHNIIFISKKDQIFNKRLENISKKTFVLYTSKEFEKNATSDKYEKNVRLMIKLSEKMKNRCKFFIYDYDYEKDMESSRMYGIQYYDGLEFKTSDYLEDEHKFNLNDDEDNIKTEFIKKEVSVKKLDYRPKCIILGEIGAGKTTLLNLLADSLYPVGSGASAITKVVQSYRAYNFDIYDTPGYRSIKNASENLVSNLNIPDLNIIVFVIKYETRYDLMLNKYEEMLARLDRDDEKRILVMVSHFDFAQDTDKEVAHIFKRFDDQLIDANVILYSKFSDKNSLRNMIYACMSNSPKRMFKLNSSFFSFK